MEGGPLSGARVEKWSGIVSVKLLNNDAFYGYRVRRSVNGKLYQEYFSLKKDGRRLTGRAQQEVEQRALKRDQELAEEQVKARARNKAERCFNADGSVRGISYLLKTEKSGALTPIFQIGIASELNNKIICTSYSLNAHGREEAWRRAVDAYARHKVIHKNSKLYQRLLESIPRVAEQSA